MGPILILVGVLAIVGQSSASNCEKMAALAASEDHSTVVETSLKMLVGSWISEGCETRPGPEYILRSYTFEDDGRYFLIQHHYWDDSCSTPQLSVLSHGKIQLRNSLVQPEAAAGTLKVSNITVIPQDTNAAKELDRTVSVECPGQYFKSWRKYEEYTVYDSRFAENKKSFKLWLSNTPNSHHLTNSRGNTVHFNDIACLGSLKYAFKELKLLKIQLRPIGDLSKKHPREVIMELLLGDIHSNSRYREYYNPSSFQLPLVKQVKDNQLTIFLNRRSYIVKNTQAIPHNIFTNTKTPPHLIEKAHLPPYIWGEWTSTRCESRPGSLFLTRRFSFYAEDETWIGDHKFYSDPFCKIPKFIVTAAGHFSFSGPNKELKGTTNIDFNIERASLTVLDQKMIYDMRLPGLCGEDDWEVNVPKELSTTGGCIQLGIILPSVQYDVVKIEMDYKGSCLLFLGQAETDNMPSDETKRPTAFQLPLVKCGEVPTYSQGLRDILNDPLYGYNGEGARSPGGIVGFIWIIVILPYFLVR